MFIYALVDAATQEVRYIGKAVDVRRRFIEHVRRGGKGHKNNWLKSINYNIDYIVIEETDPDNWISDEQFWIAYFKFLGARLTNATKGGDGTYGLKYTEERRQKLSSSLKGRPTSDNARRLSRIRLLEMWADPEQSAARRAAFKGRIIPDHVKRILSEVHKGNQHAKGYRHTQEALAKISETSKGRQPALGMKHTDEAKKRIGAAFKGKKHTEEALQNMREAQQANSEKKSVDSKRIWAERLLKISVDNKYREICDDYIGGMTIQNLQDKYSLKTCGRIYAALKYFGVALRGKTL